MAKKFKDFSRDVIQLVHEKYNDVGFDIMADSPLISEEQRDGMLN